MFTALALAAPLFAAQLPDIGNLPTLPEIRRTPQITYLDRVGNVLAVRGGQVPAPVNIDKLPPYVPAAVVSIEDRRFYSHGGFDPLGIARAVVTDITRGSGVQGASTITQQLARTLYLNQDRTLERKATELAYAIQLERKYTKKQILGLYLSRVYFGAGAYGLEAASRRYFGHAGAKLTLREAATLAGLLKNPTGYNPLENPERSAARTRLVLDAMVDTGAITAAQKARALAKPLKLANKKRIAAVDYFVDWVDPQARRLIVGPLREDLTVETTLDLALEARAADVLTQAVERNGRLGVQQGAVVALDGSGRVRAMVGGVDYASSQFNRAVQARRQAGSAWKPFVYLAALEAGRTPETPVVDEPVTIRGWSPRNYTNTYLGPITLQTALGQSINTVAARLADEVGRDRVAAAARRLGITTPINTDPAMALGTSGVAPLELATAYDAFSNGGRRVYPFGIERLRDSQDRVIWRAPAPATPQVIGNPPLRDLNRMLRGVIASGTGTKAAIAGRDLAGKTGTTSDYRDAWFAGYTGGLATVVWLGRDDARPMQGITGGGAPAETWRSFMVAALPKGTATPIPAGPPAAVVAPAPAPLPAAPLSTAPPSESAPTMRPIPDPVTDLLNATGPR